MPELITGASGVKVLSELVHTVIPFAPVSILVVVGVIILAITSGDTSLRSLRLTIAELTGLEQTSVRNRLILTIPMFVICALIILWSNMNKDGFNILWNYFSWANQLMAVCSLSVSVVYLRSKKKNFWFALLPCMFMAFITFDYILWVSPENLKGAPLGFGLDYKTALVLALENAGLLGFFLCTRGKVLTKMEGFDPDHWDSTRDLNRDETEPIVQDNKV
jgi:carbon starvation protein CstA